MKFEKKTLKTNKFKNLFVFFSIFIFNFTFLLAKNNIDIESNMKIKEDIEIENIQLEISSLQEKIKKLQEIKKIKTKNFNTGLKSNLKIGLTLSGGGAKGYAHLGVLKILEQEKIKIDYITGTSIGALIGTLYSVGYSLKKIEKILDQLNVENFLETGNDVSNFSIEEKESLRNYGFFINYDNNLKFSLPEGIRNNKYMYLELRKLLKNYMNIKNFNELPIPIRIIATNLNTGKTKAFAKGDLAKILTASMAIPGLIEPVKIDKNFYVDGLVSRNLPVQDNYNMGADIVIASDIGKEIEKKENYNIFSVINQIIEIQSSNSIFKEREKASILIRPNIQNISAIDTSQKNKLIKLGKIAAISNLKLLNKLPKQKNKYYKKFITSNKLKTDNDEILYIKNIVYSDNFKATSLKILDDTFYEFINKNIKEDDIENALAKIYNLKYFKNLYYYFSDNTLYINGEDNYQNKLGISFNYKSGYGSTLTLGTDLYFRNILGNNIYASTKVGDYLGLKLSANSYYGITNKIGIFGSLGYNQRPFYVYDHENKISKYINEELFLDMGIFTQPRKNFYLAYGINTKLLNLKLNTGDNSAKKLEYSKNINKTYIRMKYDSLNSLTFPMSGLKADFVYTFSSTLGRSKTNSYGPSYSIKGYRPINKKLSIMYGLNSAFLNGTNIKSDQYIKLGGIGNSIENNEFEFYGFNFQEKSVDKFLSLSLGFRYKPIYSVYLSTKFNSITFNEHNFNSKKKNIMWKDFSKGIGVSLGYASPLGPIEFSISSDLRKRKPIASISIGYIID